MPTGPQRVSWGGRTWEVATEHDVALSAMAVQLDEARAVWAAAVAGSKAAVREAAASGMSERAIARALGVDRRTVHSWRSSE